MFVPLCTAALMACGGEEPGPRVVAGDWRGVPLDAPIVRPDFRLTATDGSTFDFRRETEGRLTLLFFGYTFCPDICPVHLTNLAAVLRQLPYDAKNRVAVVFVSTDPERDTAPRIREWLDAMDPSFIGLRGTIDEVNAIQRAVGLPPAMAGLPTGDAYAVGHAAQILAFAPDGPARFAYPFGTRQADWLADIPRLLDSP
jgi:protein SCO1/2